MKFIFFTLSPFLLVFLMLTGADTLYAQKKSAANKKQDNTVASSNSAIHAGPDSALLSSMEWRHLGPFRGGRSCAVAGVPGKPNLFYFGATGGGIWKTYDGGRTWENISDGFFGGSIGSITVAPSDQNVIYVGGGEKTVRGNVSSGSGVYKLSLIHI